jgi:hypothetical protein
LFFTLFCSILDGLGDNHRRHLAIMEKPKAVRNGEYMAYYAKMAAREGRFVCPRCLVFQGGAAPFRAHCKAASCRAVPSTPMRSVALEAGPTASSAFFGVILHSEEATITVPLTNSADIGKDEDVVLKMKRGPVDDLGTDVDDEALRQAMLG